MRDVVGKKAKLQIGISIPVFALTDEGKRLVLNRALHFQGGLVMHRAGLPLDTGGQATGASYLGSGTVHALNLRCALAPPL